MKYGKATVIFDGYMEGPSTKDCAHFSRSTSTVGRRPTFTGEMTLKMKKSEFPANNDNKQRFVNFLDNRLERIGCEIRNAKNVADLLNVKTAVELALLSDVVLAGDDTDLFIRLCCFPDARKIIAFSSCQN